MIKVMIVGCGAIAPAHIEGYLSFPELARVTVLAAPHREKAEALNKRYGLSAKIVEDYREALGEVDAVCVCTPPGLHRETAIAALEAGCHVLLEKPMAPSLEDCDAILGAAQRSGKLLSVVVQSRFVSGVKNVIDMVRSGDYGKNYYARVDSAWYRGQSYYDMHWRGRWEAEGGGCTMNHSIHHIDLLLWAKGMPKEVRSLALNLNHENSEEEDFSSSVLLYEDGSAAELTSSLISHGEPQSLQFQMEDGGLSIPFQAFASKPRENGFPDDDEERKKRMEEDFACRPRMEHEHHAGQIGNFLRAVLGKEELAAGGVDGRNCIELITGIYKSAFTGRPAVFPIEKDDPYYSGKWKKSAVHFHEKQRDVSGFSDTRITDFKEKYK